jgi:DNA polymerase IV (DinB-like DNA polymerase)
MAILAAAGDAFQKTSVDEAYLELSSLGSFDAAVERARRLKAEIVSQEGLTASVGVGPNKLVAKIASDFQKPDGLTVVRPEKVQPFLDSLRIRVIPGIGPKTERFLHERHIRTVADLRTLERAQLAEWFGRWGEDLFAKARGLSESASPSASRRRSKSTPWTRRSCWSAPARWPARCGAGSRLCRVRSVRIAGARQERELRSAIPD